MPVEAKENTVTLGSVYGAVVKLLKARGLATLKEFYAAARICDLVLGDGAGIPWKL